MFLSRLPQSRRIRLVSQLLLLVFAVQAVVPAGYMPAAIASGQFVQLCPDQASPELMALLHPEHATSMSAGDHTMPSMQSATSTEHASGHHTGAEADNSGEWRAPCPLGGALSADVITPLASSAPEITPTNVARHWLTKFERRPAPRFQLRHARAPPVTGTT